MGTVVNRSCHCMYGEPREITFRFSKFLKRDIKFEFSLPSRQKHSPVL